MYCLPTVKGGSNGNRMEDSKLVQDMHPHGFRKGRRAWKRTSLGWRRAGTQTLLRDTWQRRKKPIYPLRGGESETLVMSCSFEEGDIAIVEAMLVEAEHIWPTVPWSPN